MSILSYPTPTFDITFKVPLFASIKFFPIILPWEITPLKPAAFLKKSLSGELMYLAKSAVYSKSRDLDNNPVETKKLGDRTVHYCPSIQV